jgi:hypothetical protein
MLASCGESDRSARSERTPAPAASVRTPPPLSPEEARRAAARREAALLRQAERELHFAPNPWPRPRAIRPHPGAHVRRIMVRDVKTGRGPVLGRGEDFWGEFIQAYHRSGTVYHGAWGRPVYIVRAAGSIGFNRGVTGMRPGGRRVIVIPRRLADVHDPDGTGWEIGYVDVVLRAVVPPE